MTRSRRICGHTFVSDLTERSVVFDLGGNRGEFSHAILASYGCSVFCVEPFPANIERIKPHERLTLFPMAVGDHDGPVDLRVAADHDPSLVMAYPGETEPLRVQCMTLRTMRERASASDIHLLKVDIEGAEIQVFDAAADGDFADIRQISMEFHAFLDASQKLPAEALISRLSRYFHVIRMSTNDSDVLFLNRLHYSRLQAMRLRYVTKYARGLRRVVARRFSR